MMHEGEYILVQGIPIEILYVSFWDRQIIRRQFRGHDKMLYLVHALE